MTSTRMRRRHYCGSAAGPPGRPGQAVFPTSTEFNKLNRSSKNGTMFREQFSEHHHCKTLDAHIAHTPNTYGEKKSSK